MNVKLIRMWSGEDVIADLIDDKDETIVIANPIVAVPAGNGQMGFAPWSPLLKGKNEELEDRKSTRLNSSHSQQSRMPSSA